MKQRERRHRRPFRRCVRVDKSATTHCTHPSPYLRTSIRGGGFFFSFPFLFFFSLCSHPITKTHPSPALSPTPASQPPPRPTSSDSHAVQRQSPWHPLPPLSLPSSSSSSSSSSCRPGPQASRRPCAPRRAPPRDSRHRRHTAEYRRRRPQRRFCGLGWTSRRRCRWR
ncbi:hypothetical protein JOL62DRAFT_326043 [Phyllosticta paracitricarpa]|uniref:Uncharacterized protein n=1 Tax=Phyllosticta paracitricarpa TaxID=2016321 RepID=A0ABR1MUU5_9PEZI